MTERTKTCLTTLAAIAGIAAVTLTVFGRVLWHGDPYVATYPGTDVILQYAQYRYFAAMELLQGDFPQWNPYLFCGMPYHATWQSALLYPINVVYLALSIQTAVNIDLMASVFLCGTFMVLWARGRGLSAPASFFAGCVTMLSGAYYCHVQPGHASYLAGFAWAPLVFLAADKLLESPRLTWVLLGAMAVCMQIFGAHPQAVYVTAFAMGPYCLLNLLHARKRFRSGMALAAMGLLAALLGAIQLWPGVFASDESSRAGGVGINFATDFSMPPENFLTAIVPGLFGRVDTPPYWGQWLIWEVHVFIGITALAFALYGARWAPREQRRYLLLISVFLAAVSVGLRTPLYGLLFHYAPGFNMFRVPARYLVPATMFVGLLAAAGFDALRRRRHVPRFLVSILAASVCATLLALAFHWYVTTPADAVRPAHAFLRVVHAWFAAHWPLTVPPTPEASQHVVRGLLMACLVGATLVVLFSLNRVGRWPAYAALCLGVAELVLFARANTGMAPFETALPEPLAAIRQDNPGDYRVLLAAPVNQTMMHDMYSVWGYDSWLLGRYYRLMSKMTAPTGIELGGCGYLDHFNPLFAMLRLRYYVDPNLGDKAVREFPDPLPHALIVHDYKVAKDADESLKMTLEPGFDPRKTVILEQEPSPKPDPNGAGGRVQVLDLTTDTLTCEVYTEYPALLLITDAYSRDWRVSSLKPAGEPYAILPANYALRAIPLSAGRHLIRMVYTPRGFVAGAWVSALSWFAAFLLGVWMVRRSRRKTAALHYALEDVSADLAVNPVRPV
ncbi:MAG: YfhO family protein [Candidatus Hydrogenedentes bacterium]|nr:YfhO family protein [Candidatus Hydrogenedentota bacterium]